MKRNAILFLTFGLILVVIGSLWMYLSDSFTKDKEVQNNIQKIKTMYDKFEEKLSVIRGEREIINNDLANNYYEENVNDSYDTWIEKLNIYQDSIKEIEKYKFDLNNLCQNKKFSNTDVKSKCESMLIGYETSINYFVKDIDDFNKFIEIYNSNNKGKEKILFMTDYKYIDMNDDGKYLGK